MKFANGISFNRANVGDSVVIAFGEYQGDCGTIVEIVSEREIHVELMTGYDEDNDESIYDVHEFTAEELDLEFTPGKIQRNLPNWF